MTCFPMFIDLNTKPVLVVGGGNVALRKVQKLVPYGAAITVVAPEILAEIEQLPSVKICKRAFCESDLEMWPELVIAATDDTELNDKISTLCKTKKIPVNVVDDPEKCTFLFPALVHQGDFSAGICTGGASPTAAVYYKERLQALLPENLDEILAWLESKRQEMKKNVPDQAKRAKIFRALFESCIEKGRALTESELDLCHASHLGKVMENGISEDVLQRKDVLQIEEEKKGSVALVGAGCGKADLITVRGLRLLQQCEAVVYDDLIDPELLESVPVNAIRVYVGKRSGAHSSSQLEINQKLIELAQKGLRVVRLKGGDPYLFGRGGEEMQALAAEGISCQEVPGIPSAIGIPAEAGIPVTHRGISRGLHIVTAHTSDTEDHLPEDFDYLAKLSGTLVFLMGLSQLPRIAERLLAAGKSGDTPAAVLSGGNSLNPARVHAPLSQIVQAVQDAKVVSPAIILIGEVAGLNLSNTREFFDKVDFRDESRVLNEKATLSIANLQSERDSLSMTELQGERDSLTGVRVGITGTEEIATKQQELLKELGAESVWVARSQVKELPFTFDFIQNADKKCWLVFTSANGVKIFFDHLKDREINLEFLKNYKYAVIGAATKMALEQYGIKADLCPGEYTSEGLVYALTTVAKQEEKIILLRSAAGSPILPEILEKNGYMVQDIPTYELETETKIWEELPELDYLTFSSASGVELFFNQYQEIPKGIRPVCIGRVTAKVLSQYTEDFLVAKIISAEGMIQSIIEDRN